MLDSIKALPVPDLAGVIQVLILTVVFYYIILFFRGTRGAAILSGFFIFLVVGMLATEFFALNEIHWLLKQFSLYVVLAILIIFQPEIRRALAELGRQPVFSSSASETRMVEQVSQAMMMLADRRIGALVAIEGEIGTRAIQETGTRIEGPVTKELLATLFYPNTPLHDGGVIIAGNLIMAAGCLFSLSQHEGFSKDLGMRHRAALGMSEETDSVVVVVSEETGTISVAYRGNLSRDFDEARLTRLLNRVLGRGRRARSRLSRVKKQLDLTPEGVAKTEETTEQVQSHAG